MALQYRVPFTSSDAQNILQRNDRQQTGVRTWNQLFGNAALNYQSQIDESKSYYSDAMAQAYKSNFERQNAIIGAGLNIGSTSNLISANRQELQNTYDTYIKNYASNVASAAESYGEDLTTIQNALTQRATNFSNLYNKTYDYLSNELYGSAWTYDDTNSPIYDKKDQITGYNQITKDYLAEHNMDWLTETDTKGNKVLSSWDTIKSKLVDEKGNLTKEGTQFFDQIFNTLESETQNYAARNFNTWLGETDSDLYNWYTSQDIYNYNLTGRNLGTANVMSGRESTDVLYGNYEYLNAEDLKDFDSTLMESDAYKNVLEKAENEARAKKVHQLTIEHDSQKTLGTYLATEYTKEQVIGAWNEYKSYINNTITALDTKFKGLVGSKLYNEFIDTGTGKNLYEQYKEITKQLMATKEYDENLAKQVDNIYTKLITEMKSFMLSKSNKKTTSGF